MISNYDLSKDSELLINYQRYRRREEEGNNTRISNTIQSISLDTTVIPTYRERKEKNLEEENYPITKQLSTYYKQSVLTIQLHFQPIVNFNQLLNHFCIEPVVNQDPSLPVLP